MRDIPTADEVAIAIVTAARFMDENPEHVVTGVVGLRARHYALHALLHVFQGLPRTTAARLVGCPGAPHAFWNQSWHQVAKSNGFRRRMVLWWSDAEYGAVIAAIEAVGHPKVDTGFPQESATRALVVTGPAPDLHFRSLPMRRAPARFFENVTAELMGDRPSARPRSDEMAIPAGRSLLRSTSAPTR